MTSRGPSLALIAATLLLSSCSSNNSPEDFESEDQRDQALTAYACQQYLDSPGVVAQEAQEAYESIPGLYAPLGDLNMDRHTAMIINGTIEPTCDQNSPMYEEWIIVGYKARLDEQGFDYETAKDAGVIDEN